MKYLWVVIFVVVFTMCLVLRILFPTKLCEHFSISKSPFKELKLSKDEHSTLLSIMKRFDLIMKENSVEYFVIAGSLMGAMRYNNRMPWDDDIDVGMMADLREKFEALPFAKYGLGLRKVYFGYKVYDLVKTRRAKMEPNFPFVDVFTFVNNGDEVIYESLKARKIWPKEAIKHEHLYPLTECQYANMSLPCPADSRAFLSQAFNGWETMAYIAGSHTGDMLFRNYKMPINETTTGEVLEYIKTLHSPT
jgi:phosphorylcholine metabolism protein LicD